MSKSCSVFLLLLLLFSPFLLSQARELHAIKFKLPGLYPEGLTYDPLGQYFIVASLNGNKFHSVSDAGVTGTLTLISSQISPNSTILGLSVDHRRRRLLAAINSDSSPFLASFNLHRSSLDLQFLSPLTPSIGLANDVAVDSFGNAYVTNSDKNFIWKVDENGTVSVLSSSPLFTRYPVDPSPYSYCGINGVVYMNTKGYLLVVQSNTGKMFKVDAVDGTARTVVLPESLTLADGIAVRDDGVVVVVSMNSAWFLKSDDSWAQGVIIDKIALDEKGTPTSVSVGGGGRVYVVYGYVQEAINGNSKEREWFRIEEIRAAQDSEEESIWWVFMLVGLGLAYFIYWKIQMGKLVNDLDRKRA